MTRQVFTLPDLGEGLTEAELVCWLVAVGDTITVDAPVAEVETAKATVEVPSPFAGTVAELHGAAGQTIAVGAPLISVDPAGAAGADPPGSGGAGSAVAADGSAAATYRAEERAGSGNVLIGYGTSAERPGTRRGRRRAAGPGLAPGRSADRPRVKSPIVRQLASRRGLDLTTITGTGPDGLITQRDVERAAAAGPGSRLTAPTPAGPSAADPLDAACPAAPGRPASAAAAPAPAATGPANRDPRTGLPIGARVALRGVRRSVTATLTRSRQEIPEATTWVDVDATALLELRAAIGGGEPPGLLAMLARFVVAGLARFPQLNSRVDTQRAEIQHLDGVHLGLAAQTERGLLVPVVRNAHRRSIRGLHAEIRRLTAAARDGRATAAELTGGSFTLNNYGVLGVDGSAAIINHPEAAILGIGRIHPRPWVVDGQVVPRRIAQLSLVFDHRVCDGGTAGGFLRYVADAIEQPLAALADL